MYSLRTWALAVAALTLVALTSPIAAGDKRSSALAVRVTVVRSCSVNTDAGVQVNPVTCGSRFGPPVMSTSSIISVPAPMQTAPAARVDTTASLRGTSPDSSTAPAPRQSDAPSERVIETSVARPAGTAADPAVPPDDPLALAADAVVAIRVVTVNF